VDNRRHTWPTLHEWDWQQCTGNRFDILFPPQGPVVITGLPDVPPFDTLAIKRIAATRFERAHQCAQAGVPKLDKPMHMVWHQDPCQGATSMLLITKAHLVDHDSGKVEVCKQRFAVEGSGCQQIEAPRLGNSSST
jgi:hypothetical protein